MSDIENSIVPFKLASLAEYVAKKKSISNMDALLYLYNTDLAANLYDPAYKLWYESDALLYQSVVKEKGNAQDANNKTFLFVVFCVERYAKKHGITSMEAYSFFRKEGVFKFLTENFEALHSQGEQYILGEIASFIKPKV